MNVPVQIVGLLVGAVACVALMNRLLRRPSVGFVRVEKQLSALRAEVAGYRAAHDHLTGALDRRLADLEKASAAATNEVRMASDLFLAGPPRDRSASTEGQR